MRNPTAHLFPLLFGVLAAIGVSHLRANRTFEVAKPTENIRATPEGRLLGTLLEGATIEEAGRDGRWVKFTLEAWIWGPSLEGYQALEGYQEPEADEGEAPDADQILDEGPDSDGRRKPVQTSRRPRIALNAHLDEVRDLIDEDMGRFYGMRLDPDLNQVQIRFRVREIDPQVLQQRQMRVQHAVLQLLSKDVGSDSLVIKSLWIETNRADGSGEVGTELAVATVADIRKIGGDNLALWQQLTRRSSDSGESWVGPEQ